MDSLRCGNGGDRSGVADPYGRALGGSPDAGCLETVDDWLY